MLWGWCPALLFAVHPQTVWGVAWVTGNYYATAAYFTLIVYFLIHTFPNIWGVLAAMPIYVAALNSTVCPITFPFLFLFIGQPWGLTMFLPLATFLTGKKFRTGIKIRFDINNDKVFREGTVKFNPFRRFAAMTKVVGRYIYGALVPIKLGFFDGYGRNLKQDPKIYNKYHSFDKEFWACFTLCWVTFIAGYLMNPLGIFWFFTFISLHSQFNLTGQYFAQRYLYLSLIGVCICLGTALVSHPILLTIVVTLLIARTHYYIPAWKNQMNVWLNDLQSYPECAQAWNNAAQYFLQVSKEVKPYTLNRVAYYLFRAEDMEPDSWEIQMNIACFFAKVGKSDELLKRTRRAIDLLEPLGGIKMPIEMLRKQEKSIVEYIEKQKAGVFPVKESTVTGGLGDLKDHSLSHPEVDNPLNAEKEGRENGKSTGNEEVATTHQQCCGSGGA